ncbi:MAG: Maf family protein [Candidatus Scalindua sp.]|nr:Maf family protein [Candidatus Scalindua sp.]
MSMKNVYLASFSPRRQQLLKDLSLDFIVSPPVNFVEKQNGMEPEELVCHNALGKAKEVAGRQRDSIIIGCDTLIEAHDEVFGKPLTSEKAFLMLKKLSGSWHSVYSGLAVIDTEISKELVGYGKTDIKFKELSEKEIIDYIKTGEPLDKAGAYGIQEYGGVFVDEIKGSFSTVVGLPKGLLVKFLSEVGIRI